jgi:ubiquinone/menaquinone biosynthesis C-methylase UbiE
MYRLPFADRAFDTILLDDVLGDARRPVQALAESKRLLRAGGRVIVLERRRADPAASTRQLAEWCVAGGLRLAPARFVPPANPEWLVSVATAAAGREAAA